MQMFRMQMPKSAGGGQAVQKDLGSWPYAHHAIRPRNPQHNMIPRVYR